ncbi:MAG: LysM peptidoglycan-binding domain-containing protein [Bacteroidota bacterium]
MNIRLIFFVLVLAALSVAGQTYQEQLKNIRSTVIEQKDGKSFYIHSVKRGQTLYMISKAYGVEVNDIIDANPIVREGLKADQKLYIPVQEKQVVEETKKSSEVTKKTSDQPPITSNQPPITNNQPPTTNHQPPITSNQTPCGSDTSAARHRYNVVLMLPLYLGEVEAMNPETATEEMIDSWNPSKYLPFYNGFMLAVDSLRKQGLNLVLHVYDVGKDSARAQQLLKKPDVKAADLIVGVLFNKSFQIVAKFAHENKIPIVNPLSERTEIVRDNELVFKTNPSRSFFAESLADYFQKGLYRGQIIIIRNGQFRDKDIADKLKKECLERNLNVFLAEGQDGAIGKLSKSKENVIVAFADNNVYALDLMRRFYELRNDYKINLVGLPDWEKIEGLETDFLNGLETHFVTAGFVDYGDKQVQNLVRSYQDKLKSDPEPLAFQGFDVGYYFLSAMMKFGKSYPACISGFRLKTVQTNFDFVKSGNAAANGFENRHWTVYKYENFRLIRLN